MYIYNMYIYNMYIYIICIYIICIYNMYIWYVYIICIYVYIICIYVYIICMYVYIYMGWLFTSIDPAILDWTERRADTSSETPWTFEGWKEKPSCSKRVPLGIIEHILRRTPIQPSLIYINRTEMWKTPSFVDQSPKGKPYVTMNFPQPF